MQGGWQFPRAFRIVVSVSSYSKRGVLLVERLMKANAEMAVPRKMDVYVLAQQSVGSFKTNEDTLKRFSMCTSLST